MTSNGAGVTPNGAPATSNGAPVTGRGMQAPVGDAMAGPQAALEATPDTEVAARLGRLPSRPSPASGPVEAAAEPRPAHDADSVDGVSLARLARGIQDCARAVSCLADRLDRLERRLDSATTHSPAGEDAVRQPAFTRPAADRDGFDLRLRALEGMAADRLQGIDQRLRRLENLPPAVGRVQKDVAWLTELATTRRIDEAASPKPAAAPDLAPVYQELDSVADLVSSHHAAATQSLERVRTLERAVLEMRRHLERNLAEQSVVVSTGQATADGRIQRLEARLSAVETRGARTGE